MTNPTAHNPAVLDEASYIQFVSYPESSGWNASTHLAKVDFGHGDEFAYIKLMFLDAIPSLANEAIGWTLARAVGIPVPSRTAIMIGSADFWRDKLGRLPPDCPTDGDIAAWCSTSCDCIEQHTWISLDNDQAAIKLAKSPRGQQILAFYTWLHNADGNPRNLLRLGDGDWAVIDHEFLFNGVLGNWRKPPQARNFADPPYLLERIRKLTEEGKISKKANAEICSGMIHYGQLHQGAIAKTLPYLSDTLDKIELPAHARSALPLIVDRAWNFWMPKMVNQLL